MKIKNRRRCIVTRKVYDKQDLIRVVKTKSGEYLIDSSAQGRGAYIYKDAPIENIEKQRLLNRTFKTQVPNEVYKELINKLEKR